MMTLNLPGDDDPEFEANRELFTESDPPKGAGALIPRATVERIVKLRNEALDKYGVAHHALDAALAASVDAGKTLQALSGRENRFNYHQHGDKTKFMRVKDAQNRDDYLKHARRIVDTEVWAHVIEITDLERLMDKQAKDELHRQLMEEPPEVTVENIRATLQQFMGDAGTIFKRGIANAFSKLDRRFRSHDGWKIGGRMILDRMYDQSGFMNYHRDMESTLMDIERTFRVLDGQPGGASRSGIVSLLSQSRYTGNGARQGEVEDEFFKVRVFKNGNCHCWFKRDDLVERVNKLLGEYYGAPIPEERGADDADPFSAPKTALAKNYGFFPTPDDVAARALDGVPFHRREGEPPLLVLEPSAGNGALAKIAADAECLVDCVEVHVGRADALRKSKRYRNVICADFLAWAPGAELYDVIVMNPPFDRERDIDHVVHAMKFLKPGGHLCAIMSAGTEFRETKKSQAFRELMEAKKARWRDLPAGSFSSVGTNCNTVTIRFYNDGKHFYG